MNATHTARRALVSLRAIGWASLFVLMAAIPAAAEGDDAAGSRANEAKANAEAAEKIRGWLRQLGDENFDLREKAEEQLRLAGEAVLPLVEKEFDNADSEIRARARRVASFLQTEPILKKMDDAWQRAETAEVQWACERRNEQTRKLILSHNLTACGTTDGSRYYIERSKALRMVCIKDDCWVTINGKTQSYKKDTYGIAGLYNVMEFPQNCRKLFRFTACRRIKSDDPAVADTLVLAGVRKDGVRCCGVFDGFGTGVACSLHLDAEKWTVKKLEVFDAAGAPLSAMTLKSMATNVKLNDDDFKTP